MKCDQCGVDLNVGDNYVCLSMKVGPRHVPSPPPKYHVYSSFLSSDVLVGPDSYSIEDANLCGKCGKESVEFIKSLGAKLLAGGG